MKYCHIMLIFLMLKTVGFIAYLSLLCLPERKKIRRYIFFMLFKILKNASRIIDMIDIFMSFCSGTISEIQRHGRR